MTRADQLTWSRLILGPLAFALLIAGDTHGKLWWVLALVVTIAGDLTDHFDGILARKAGGGTDMGKLADPFTDSVFRLCVYLGLTAVGAFPAWCFLLLMLRDSSNLFLRQLAALKGVAFGSLWSGKVKAWVQAIAAYVFLTNLLIPVLPAWFLTGGAAFVALYTFGSGIDYLLAFRRGQV